MRAKNFGKIRFSVTKIMIGLSVFFLVLYPYSVSLSRYVYPSTNIKYLTLLFAAFSFVFLYFKSFYNTSNGVMKFRLSNYEILFGLIGIYITINNYDIRNGSYYYVISFWTIWLIMVTSKYSRSCQRILFRFMEIFTLFYALVTIITLILPSVYFQFVIPLFDTESQKQLIKAYENGYMAGLTDHYSTNGMYMSVGVGIFGSKLLFDFKSKKNWLFVIISLAALLLTGKRGPLLFSIAAMVAVYFFFKEDKPKGRLLKIFCVMVIGVLGLLIASIFVPQLLNVVNRFLNESDNGDVTAGRGPLYQLAYELFLSKPITGHGWGSYPTFYYEQLGKSMTVYQYRHAHNIYLQLLCETGIIGFAMYIIFFIYNIFITIKLYKAYRKDDIALSYSAEYILPFCLFIQIFFVMYGMTGNPLYDIATLFPYYFSLLYVNYYRKNLVKIKNTKLFMKYLYKKGDVKI